MRKIRTAIIIAVLRRMCPDWTERVEDWADTYRKIAKTCDRLHQEIFGIAFDLARSPLFAPVRRPLFRQEILATQEGVAVTAIYRGDISLLRPPSPLPASRFSSCPSPSPNCPVLCRTPQRSLSWRLRDASSRSGCFATSSTAATIASRRACRVSSWGTTSIARRWAAACPARMRTRGALSTPSGSGTPGAIASSSCAPSMTTHGAKPRTSWMR